MNAQWNWLKTVLALMFFLCTLFLMPERAPAQPVSSSSLASGRSSADDDSCQSDRNGRRDESAQTRPARPSAEG